MTTATIEIRNTNAIKQRWSKLRGDEHTIDFERAKLLHRVYKIYQKDEDLLADFIVGVLDEYPGKRTQKFVRFVVAFDTINTESVWKKIGGNGVVLLARADGRKRRTVLNRVDGTIEDTGRPSMSQQTFRNILKDVLTPKGYEKILTERNPVVGGSTRAQLRALRGWALKALRKHPDLKRRMPKEVKTALGMDQV